MRSLLRFWWNVLLQRWRESRRVKAAFVIRCSYCNDRLATDDLEHELAACRCGRTYLDKGRVWLA